MIKIEKINKYFNRHKKNELHVINDTSLEFENTGLVALLGPSGSGKTTLLNVIGGLDNVKSGKIYVNGQKITGCLSGKRDKVRNLNIGYIFQDYKLIDNLSVYDNVALALEIVGIKDKKEIDKRVSYVLEKVGMYRYRHRPANMLSGGERQRIGIARAIVKNPNIIIADEPTGNLDSKNSIEIMNIIKAISKDRLVILVTHETPLANFYASRIIEISDGKIIKDYPNIHNNELDYTIDNRFYLKDFKEQQTLTTNNNNIKIYSDKKETVKLDIVIKNNNIYIKTNDNKTVEVIDSDSNIEMIDDHYKKIDQEDINKYEFDFENIIDKNRKLKYSSIFNPITFISNGFKKVFSYSLIKKILLGGFFLSGIFIIFAISQIGAVLDVRDGDFLTVNKNYLAIKSNKISVEDYQKYESESKVDYIIPGDSIIKFVYVNTNYYQTSKEVIKITGSLSSTDLINESDILYGRMPENNQEIVIDTLAIKNTYKKYPVASMMNLKNPTDILNETVYIQNMPAFKIVGITNLGDPSIYASKDAFTDIIYNSKHMDDEYGYRLIIDAENKITGIQDYNLYLDKISLVEGSFPQNDYEVIINKNHKDSYKIGKEISVSVNERKLKVVGYYTSEDNYDNYFVNTNTIKYQLITESKNITIKPTDKKECLDELRSKYQINIYDTYVKSKSAYDKSRKDSVLAIITSSFIILLISLIEIFLMIRSSFLSRIKEVGIYRAIGVKKKDIYIMFSGEIIAITTLASLPGIILCSYILNIITTIPYLERQFLVNSITVSLAIILVYAFNLLVGLIPVFATIWSPPAKILARTDVE